MAKSLSKFTSILILMLGIAACGQKGPLIVEPSDPLPNEPLQEEPVEAVAD